LIQKDYDYIQGATARKIQYDVYEENTVLKAKKRYKNNRKIKFKLVLSILAVLVAGLTVMYRFALITHLSYTINQNEKMYNELRNENSLLKVQIETETDLTDIKETAETRLGMQKPDKSQIVYIKVPRNDYTMVINTQDEAGMDDGNIIKLFINKAAGLVRLLE
jgi:cell division protein FtsL